MAVNMLALLPAGKAGLAIKLALGLAAAVFWTSAPGAEEASDFKAKAEKRRAYSRHYAFKGRGRKEYFRRAVKYDRAEIAPTRAFALAK